MALPHSLTAAQLEVLLSWRRQLQRASSWQEGGAWKVEKRDERQREREREREREGVYKGWLKTRQKRCCEGEKGPMAKLLSSHK
jgi:hypothetical protein